MKSNCTYSVVIPHHNTPRLLQRLVATIPIRDDIEIIVVDDNSDEDKIAEVDHVNANIIYIDKANTKGAGRARNIGMKEAIGKWIIFADADDFFYPEAFPNFDKYKDSDNDIIYFYCNSRDGETLEIIPDRVKKIKIGIETHDFNLLRYGSSVPWGKMIKRNIIEKYNIQFDEVPVSNDIMFSIKIGYYSSKIDVISIPLYCCTANQDSLFYKRDSERMKIRLLVAAKANTFFYDHNIDYQLRSVLQYAFYFFPHQLKTFIWALWKGRYKGHTIRYMVDIIKRFIKRLIRV